MGLFETNRNFSQKNKNGPKLVLGSFEACWMWIWLGKISTMLNWVRYSGKFQPCLLTLKLVKWFFWCQEPEVINEKFTRCITGLYANFKEYLNFAHWPWNRVYKGKSTFRPSVIHHMTFYHYIRVPNIKKALYTQFQGQWEV